ncbi:MAG: hypothetical protein ACE37F_10765 [Nannocystaceae bacterium]|nr:hypothetical protein [bacterium]
MNSMHDPYAFLPGLTDLETRLFSAPVPTDAHVATYLEQATVRRLPAANVHPFLPDPPRVRGTSGLVVESVLLRAA